MKQMTTQWLREIVLPEKLEDALVLLTDLRDGYDGKGQVLLNISGDWDIAIEVTLERQETDEEESIREALEAERAAERAAQEISSAAAKKRAVLDAIAKLQAQLAAMEAAES